MDKITKIIKNNQYINNLKKIKEYEKKRKYCKHNIKHFLDVARIAYILNLENNLHINKEIIYATALLHDIGKWEQYENSTPHEIASSKLCKPILEECGFNENEIEIINIAILNHRNENVKNELTLSGIIYKADKLSRKCFMCKVNKECNWTEDKKNNILVY